MRYADIYFNPTLVQFKLVPEFILFDRFRKFQSYLSPIQTLWPVIERALGEVCGTDERAALLARRAELVAELERIDEQIRAMEERE